MPVAHKNYLTDRREQHGMQDTRLLGSFQSHQADVEIFQREGKFYEYNLVKKSISSTSCFTFKELLLLVKATF